jgi:hypothetical protein
VKNKAEIGGIFLAMQKAALTHHVYHAFHHDLTIKKPRSALTFSEYPLQNRLFATTKNI